MGAEFWLGFSGGALVCFMLLFIVAVLAMARDNSRAEERRSRDDHPTSYGIAHMKVVDPIDLPLPPRDRIGPVPEVRKEGESG